MPVFINAVGSSVLSNIIQIALGSLLAVIIYRNLSLKAKGYVPGFCRDIILISIFALVGILLPAGTYAVVPIMAAMILAGFRLYVILPFVLTNYMFNMLVPFTDASFIWRTGYRRVIFAFAAGILVGIALRLVKSNHESIFKVNNLASFERNSRGFKDIINVFGQYVGKAGVYLIFGVLADILFHRYALSAVFSTIISNPQTAFVPRLFSGLNVVNPFFLLTMTIAGVFMDFIKLSALSFMFKLKALCMFYLYFAIWAVLFSVSAFI